MYSVVFLGWIFKNEGLDLKWERPIDPDNPQPPDPLNFITLNSYIRALFCLEDRLYVATENGGLYRIEDLELGVENIKIVRCRIIEAGRNPNAPS